MKAAVPALLIVVGWFAVVRRAAGRRAAVIVAALLVGLIPNPYKYSPLDHRELAEARLRTVLKRMVKDGYLADSALDRVEKDFWAGFSSRGAIS